MKIIYIKGKGKYRYGIRKGLSKSELIEGTDYISGASGNDHCLIWIKEDLDLRDFKKAISAKYVFKYRLRFYKSIEEMNPKKDDVTLSSDDLQKIEQMKKGFKKI